MASRRSSFVRCMVAIGLLAIALFSASALGNSDGRPEGAPSPLAASSNADMRRVVLLGLRSRGKVGRFARRASNPASPAYRRFLSPAKFRKRFSAGRRDRRRVKRYLASQNGISRVELNPSGTAALAVTTPRASKRLFCAAGIGPPSGKLCTPRLLRGAVRYVSAGELYPPGGEARSRSGSGGSSAKASGTPAGCQAAIATGAFTPNQLATAYGADRLRSRGLSGAGVRVATLSSQEVNAKGFNTWAQCFGLPTPRVTQVSMPGAVAGTAPEETILDVEALAGLAPGLERITPIFVPLDQSFTNSFLLFMFGALDPARQGGELPDILSISDGVCESRFTADQLRFGQRQLAEAAAQGITTLAASGDLGFQGCFVGKGGALFPSSSRFTTSVGGTDLTLTGENEIADQAVWSTYAEDAQQGVGTGGGPSQTWSRPGFQRAPGIGPALQAAKATRLAPDVASMAAFNPGLATYDQDGGGWGVGGGTSAATPLTAATIALVLEAERAAGRPALGSLPPLLYELARGPDYGSIFYDVKSGTSSRKPSTPTGRAPAGGAAQPGYDMATGLGSLRAAQFADAVAALPNRP